MTIRVIEHDSEDYLAALRLRDVVLRVPLGLSIADDDLSAELSQVHFAFIDDRGEIQGCLILRQATGKAVQMRQLAVAASAQGQGIGRALVAAAEDHAREHLEATLLYCHARQVVVPFYEKLGYEAIGEPFTEVTIPHRRMEKNLSGGC